MVKSYPAHLHHLAAARAILALLAGTDDSGETVSAILAGDEAVGELAGITLDQRLRYIDVTEGTDSALAAADEITNIVCANHGSTGLAGCAAHIDLIRTFRIIAAETAEVDYTVLSANGGRGAPTADQGRDAIFRLQKIGYLVEGIVALLGPSIPNDEDMEEVDQDGFMAAAE